MVHQDGISIGLEKVRLIGCREGLQVPVKSPKRRRRSIGSWKVSKARWPMCGAMISSLSGRKTLKFLAVVDEFSRVALSLSCVLSLTGPHVIRTLETRHPVWGATDCLRSDNGSEFVARQVKKWFFEHGIGTH